MFYSWLFSGYRLLSSHSYNNYDNNKIYINNKDDVVKRDDTDDDRGNNNNDDDDGVCVGDIRACERVL